MNWYKQIKIAFPYGNAKCPNCHKTFTADFGYNDSTKGGSSTQNLSKTPFIDLEKEKYEEPIDGVSEDQTEYGTVTLECPYCHRWSEAEYKWTTNNPSTESDNFPQAKIVDIQKITPEMAHLYQDLGMTSGFGVDQ